MSKWRLLNARQVAKEEAGGVPERPTIHCQSMSSRRITLHQNSSIRILFSIDDQGSIAFGNSHAWIRSDSVEDKSRLSLLITRRPMKARRRYEMEIPYGMLAHQLIQLVIAAGIELSAVETIVHRTPSEKPDIHL